MQQQQQNSENDLFLTYLNQEGKKLLGTGMNSPIGAGMVTAY